MAKLPLAPAKEATRAAKWRYYALCMNLISKRKSLLKSDEIARIGGAVEELAGDSVAHDGAVGKTERNET